MLLLDDQCYLIILRAHLSWNMLASIRFSRLQHLYIHRIRNSKLHQQLLSLSKSKKRALNLVTFSNLKRISNISLERIIINTTISNVTISIVS
jgi:hypothetical protein